MSPYSAKDIVVLSGLEAVRRNPWMYVGAVSEEGAYQLLRELVYNAVDEAAAGGGKRISVTLDKASARVEDDGRGIPTEVHPTEGVSAAEVALTRLHAGSKFARKADRFSAGLHGVGLSCVNALSEKLRLEVRRGGVLHVQDYSRGKPLRPLRAAGKAAGRGTAVTFKPDAGIFKGFRGFRLELAAPFLEELSFLNPGVEFVLKEGRKTAAFKNSSGAAGLLAKLAAAARPLLRKPVEVKLSRGGLELRAALTWTAGREPVVRSFVNGVATVHGGTHVAALRAGLTRGVNRLMAETGRRGEEPAEPDEVAEGLLAVVDLKLAHPSFEGQTKTRLTNADVSAPVAGAAEAQALAHLRKDPVAAAAVTDRIWQARNAKIAARRVAEKIYFQHAARGIDEEVYKAQFGARSKNWHESAAWITDKDLLKAHADLCVKNGESIGLDVCCGSGVVGASFKGKVKKMIGLDLTPEMVKLAGKRLDEVKQGNVYKIPFPDKTFDLVCTREVLHLLPYPEKPVSEILRVLKPGGQFIVGQTLPFSADDAAWMYRVFKKKQPLIFNWFQEDDFRRLLSGAGFADVRMKELAVWESIDVWIDSVETTPLHRHEIRQLFLNAPAEAKAVHPFKVLPSGEIRDLWRWGVFSARKPA
jgi:DNA gyrase subunit B